jgi:hypothetical protein
MSFQISRYYKVLKTILWVLLLLLVFLVSVSVLVEHYTETSIDAQIKEMEKLPDANYISEIEKLREEGKLGEALELARFVGEHPDMPGHLEAKRLEKEIEAELDSEFSKILRFARGAVTGNPKTGMDAAGAVASDFCFFGDLRDLTIQGWKFISKQETDKLVVALSAIGVLTETIKTIDGVPAALKLFKKIGSITPKFGNSILEASQKALKQRKVTSELKKIFINFKDVTKNMGFTKSALALKSVDSAEDLSALAKVSAKVPGETFVILRNGGKEAFDAIKKIDPEGKEETLLKIAARKGKAGAKFLAKRDSTFSNKVLGKIQIVTRVTKDVRLRRVQSMFKAAIQSFPPLIIGVWVLVLGSAWGLFLYARRFLKLMVGKIRRLRETEA